MRNWPAGSRRSRLGHPQAGCPQVSLEALFTGVVSTASAKRHRPRDIGGIPCVRNKIRRSHMSTSTTPEPTPPTSTGPIRIGPIVATSVRRKPRPRRRPCSWKGRHSRGSSASPGCSSWFSGQSSSSPRGHSARAGCPEGFGFLAGGTGPGAHALSRGHRRRAGSPPDVRRLRRVLAGLRNRRGARARPVRRISVTRTVGLLPAAVGQSAAGFLSLLFTIPFTRHETDEPTASRRAITLLLVGGVACRRERDGRSVPAGFPRRPGLALAIARARVPLSRTSGRSIRPTASATRSRSLWGVLGRGHRDLRDRPGRVPDAPVRRPGRAAEAERSLDWWKVSFRRSAGLRFWCRLSSRALRPIPRRGSRARADVDSAWSASVWWSRRFVSNPVRTQPLPFLVPTGLILMGLGLAVPRGFARHLLGQPVHHADAPRIVRVLPLADRLPRPRRHGADPVARLPGLR